MQNNAAMRMSDIEPFRVLELVARARQHEAAGRDIVHMEIGEPDFPSPKPVIAAAQRFLDAGHVSYTPTLGLPKLREAIAAFYAQRYGINVPPRRIAVTAGGSGALLLALATLVNPGEDWLVTDPGYPCNRHFIRLYEGRPRLMKLDPQADFEISLADIERNWTPRAAGALLGSPANPTGTIIAPETIAEISTFIRERRGHLIMDEIYHGLTYDGRDYTALEASDEVFVVQSFSKYFHMTGWRLGWLVVPDRYMHEVEKLAQHLFISPSAPAQHAALAAFDPETIAIAEERRNEFRQRRDFLVSGLLRLGFKIPSPPQGAFYIYADCSALTTDSHAFARDLIDVAGVAATPGHDFGGNAPERYLRFAYTTSMDRIAEGLSRMERFLNR